MTDPRYDPRFQRGWDGETPAPPPPSPTPVMDAAPTAPHVEPGRVADAVPDPVASDETDADDVTAIEDPPPAVRNPYRLALVIIGAGLLALSGAMTWQSLHPSTASGPPSAADFVWTQIGQTLIPLLILSGVIALIVAIALGALVRRR